MISDVKYHVLRNFKSELNLADLSEAPDPLKHKDFFENYVAFTDLLPNPHDGKLYCGITAYNTDIMHRFDRIQANSRACTTIASPSHLRSRCTDHLLWPMTEQSMERQLAFTHWISG